MAGKCFKASSRKCMRKIIFSLFLLFVTAFNALAQNKGLLWQITGKNVKQPAYLFGTIHIYDTTRYRLPKAVFEKLGKVKQVYFELDFDQINYGEMMKGMIIADSNLYLNKLLDTASLTKFKSVIKSSPYAQMMGSMIYHIKPLLLSAVIMNTGKQTELDLELNKKAKTLHISTGGIETLAEQLAVINDIPIPQQADMLKKSLDEMASAQTMMDKMMNAYVKQDVDHLLQEMSGDTPIDPNFNKVFLTDRNHIMADRVVKLLAAKSTMIAVGAGHLGGKDGLIALLREKGYVLKAVPFSFEPVRAK